MTISWVPTPRAVRAVQDALDRGVPMTEIARTIGVSRYTLYAIKRKRRWTCADEDAAIAKIEALTRAKEAAE